MIAIKVEIWSDFACPFCYIGKRRFENALNQFAYKSKVEVIYKSFILNPQAPITTNLSAVTELSKAKGISEDEARAMYGYVVDMGLSAGLAFDLEKIKSTSTKSAHQLLMWSKKFDKSNDVAEMLYEGYFIKGLNLADINTLINIAASVGLDQVEARQALELKLFEEEVNDDILEAMKLGIKSVPTFVVDRSLAFSGALSEEKILSYLNKAYKESKDLIIMVDESGCGVDGCEN